jgi:CheY-like chemotaxis protein
LSVTRILIIDDNPVDVQIIRFALQEETDWPTETTVAADGEEGIDCLNRVARAEEIRPDLVILDLNLPKQDGTEVLGVMHSTPALIGIPVLILSCYPEEVILKKMVEANVSATAYMSKPSGIDEFAELGSKVRKCCMTVEGRSRGSSTTC